MCVCTSILIVSFRIVVCACNALLVVDPTAAILLFSNHYLDARYLGTLRPILLVECVAASYILVVGKDR